MTELTLFHAIPSRGLVVHWMLEELNVPYELHMLDLDAEDHKKPEYLAINPMGKVPALRHGEKIVTETAAICTYLAEAFPDAGLQIPVGSPLRADYLRWLFFAPVTAEPSILWQALGCNAADPDYKPFAELDSVASTLQQALHNGEFIVGDQFTAADVMIGSTLYWGLTLMPVFPKIPELITYWEGLARRPAWQKVLQTMP
jgi:glutathione S-transferase